VQVLKSKQIFVLSLFTVLALISMGCGLVGILGGGPESAVSVGVTPVPTRTPWPTFTPTPEGMGLVPGGSGDQQSAVVIDPPTPTPVPTDTPVPPTNTPPPVPTDTPPPPPTNTPAPPPPAPTNPPPPPAPTKSPYQFVPAPWYAGARNDAIVRFYGYLKDASGTPVNGYSVKASCGDTTVLSFPSGPSFAAPDWAPGWYDIVFPNPVSCNWTLQIVEYQCEGAGFDAQCKQFQTLSEAVPVSTDVGAGETIIVADWIKNW
jgi:hypothetical protein